MQTTHVSSISLSLQDHRIAQIVKSMMQEGLRAINQYKFSNNRMERQLAENYQRAMHSQAI